MSRRTLTTAVWCRVAVRRINRGTGRLFWHLAGRITRKGKAKGTSWWEGITGWLGEASGLAWLLRLGLLIGVAALARNILTAVAIAVLHRADAARWVMWPASIVWIIAAYRAGRIGWKPKPEKSAKGDGPAEETVAQEQPDDEPSEDPDIAEDNGGAERETAPPAPAAPPLPSLPDLRIALARVGTPHAHLAVLAADIGTTPERVREALEKWAIPIEAVRMQGRGTSTGVKGGPAVHPSLALRPEDAAVVAAGQPANNNDNNADEPYVERPVEGMLIIRHPAETASRRHTV